MNPIRDFIDKYLSGYLAQCQLKNPFLQEDKYTPYPPTSKEVEDLIMFLQNEGLDPVISGTIALIKHLQFTEADIHAREFRPTHKLEVIISKNLPNPPSGWHINKDFRACWNSPLGGRVDFVREEEAVQFPNRVQRDPESVEAGIPVADVPTIFKMKLNSDWDKDLAELMTLARKVGIPKDIKDCLWSDRQKKNMEILIFWAKLRLSDEKRGGL